MSRASIAVVIPTRNRADMAIAAIEHLRAQDCGDLKLFVSDNSSIEEEVARLADFCRSLDDPRLTYMRTPGNLHQGAHWDWAISQALERSDATHATIHYDRKILRPGQAAAWIAVAGQFPDKVFTYVTDAVSADPPPLRLWQAPWTGKLYRLETAHIAAVSASGEAAALGSMLPVLSNCLVPRAAVESIVERFGDLCDSTTADSCFAYRFCALHDDYLHLDRSLTVLYGSHRSAAVGYLSGGGGDFADYRETWRGESWLDAGIIPGLNLGYNMLFHEYELVRREVGGRLPPLDRAGCLRDLGRGLFWIRDPEAREEVRKLLVEHGWKDEEAPPALAQKASLPRRAYRRVRQHARLLLGRILGVAPPVNGFQFRSDEEALVYAVKYPSAPSPSAAHLALARPREVDADLP
ncbi:MAG TPA: glycosyltransferase [Allosphingosinicella sp.]